MIQYVGAKGTRPVFVLFTMQKTPRLAHRLNASMLIGLIAPRQLCERNEHVCEHLKRENRTSSHYKMQQKIVKRKISTAQEFSKKYPPFKILRHPKNMFF